MEQKKEGNPIESPGEVFKKRIKIAERLLGCLVDLRIGVREVYIPGTALKGMTVGKGGLAVHFTMPDAPPPDYTENNLVSFGNYLFSDKRLCFVMGKWLASPITCSFAEFALEVKEEDIKEWILERAAFNEECLQRKKEKDARYQEHLKKHSEG